MRILSVSRHMRPNMVYPKQIPLEKQLKSFSKGKSKSDHADRVKDGSITYDNFNLGKDKVEYYISKCMYVEIFSSYGIRPLCKIFCNTDRIAYSGLTRHATFVRHSDLSDGEACFDEIIRK